jgi:hypothetical protein
MLPVLDLDPVWRSAGAIAAVLEVRDQVLPAHQAGVTEQVRTDLALFEIAQEDAVDAACQQTGRFALRIDSGSLRTSSPSLLIIVLAAVQAVEVEMPSAPSRTASPSIANELLRFRSAASVINGNRPPQSWLLRVNRRTRLPSRWTNRW